MSVVVGTAVAETVLGFGWIDKTLFESYETRFDSGALVCLERNSRYSRNASWVDRLLDGEPLSCISVEGNSLRAPPMTTCKEMLIENPLVSDNQLGLRLLAKSGVLISTPTAAPFNNYASVMTSMVSSTCEVAWLADDFANSSIDKTFFPLEPKRPLILLLNVSTCWEIRLAKLAGLKIEANVERALAALAPVRATVLAVFLTT